jgi:hypothetical protein
MIYESVREKPVKSILIIGSILFIIALTHSLFGYLLSYHSKEDFLEKCVWYGKHTKRFIPYYQYSYHAIFPFIKSMYRQVFSFDVLPFLLLGISSLFRYPKNYFTFLSFAVLLIPTIILPVTTFMYGSNMQVTPNKHTEIVFFLILLSAYSPLFNSNHLNSFITKRVTSILFISALAVVICILGYRYTIGAQLTSHSYEIKNDGHGIIPWKNLSEESSLFQKTNPASDHYPCLTDLDDLTFFTLGFGMRAQKIDIIELKSDTSMDYDVILLRKDSFPLSEKQFNQLSVRYGQNQGQPGYLLFYHGN